MQDEAALPYKVTVWFIVNQTYCQRKPFKEVMGLLKRGKAGVRERERERMGGLWGPIERLSPSFQTSQHSFQWFIQRTWGWRVTDRHMRTDSSMVKHIVSQIQQENGKKDNRQSLGGGEGGGGGFFSSTTQSPTVCHKQQETKSTSRKKKSHAICIKETCFTCKSTST